MREFAFAADQVATQVRERLESCHFVLRGGVTLIEESDRVSREDWKHYFSRLDIEHTLPGVLAVAFAPYLNLQELVVHEAAVQDEGFPDYQVWPAGVRNTYAPVLYVEPFVGQNRAAFGWDMYSEPVRREALERARDTGNPELSGRVRLVAEPEQGSQAGTLMFMAVYRHDMPRYTLEQRRAALAGWVFSPYRMNDLLAGTLKTWASREGGFIDLHIYDGTKATPEALLFDSVVTETPSGDSPFLQYREINFYGHRWLLQMDRIANAPSLNYTPVWLLLASGLTITGLLAGLLVSLNRTQKNARQIAGELTAAVRTREYDLLEAQRIGRTGSWKLDLAANRMEWSQALERIFGESHEYVSGLSLSDYQQRFTEASWQYVMEAFAKILEGGEPYEQELEVISVSGKHAWLQVHGEAVRDAAGNIIALQGSAADVTERRQLELSLRKNREELEEAQRIGHTGSWKIDVTTGEVTWSDEMYRMTGYDPQLPAPDIKAQQALFTEDSFSQLSEAGSRLYIEGEPYHLELEFIRSDGSHGWMDARGEVVKDDGNQIVALRGTAADITERKRLQLRTELLSRLYAALSACNAALIHADSEQVLFEEICQIVVSMGGMAMAWIGLVDDASGMIRPVAAYGDGTGYLDGIEISIRADELHGQGPTGTATRENRPVWVQDFTHSTMTALWTARSSQYGWRASASLPLCRAGKVVGALTLYSLWRDFFDDEIRNLLEEIAGSISFGLDKIAADAEAVAHQATLRESEQRFRILVEQSIAGTFILQDGLIVYANPRAASIFGYENYRQMIGRAALDDISPKDRDRVADNMRRLIAGEYEKQDDLFTGLRQDGSTVEVGVSVTMVNYDGKPSVIGLIQDITDRQVAENQIRRYAQQLEHTFIQTVQLATTISEMRDAYTAGHERRVADIAIAIGKEMGMDSNTLEGLRIGGYLHDVGKITIPAEILAKPTRLTPTEYALIKQHAQAGYDVLKEVDFPWPVAQIALQHHERMDGSGYPQGLKGEEIILEARIIAVADVIESMASHRPYRPGLGIDKAMAEVERGRGTAYDDVVVAACLRLFREKSFALPPH